MVLFRQDFCEIKEPVEISSVIFHRAVLLGYIPSVQWIQECWDISEKAVLEIWLARMFSFMRSVCRRYISQLLWHKVNMRFIFIWINIPCSNKPEKTRPATVSSLLLSFLFQGCWTQTLHTLSDSQEFTSRHFLWCKFTL